MITCCPDSISKLGSQELKPLSIVALNQIKYLAGVNKVSNSSKLPLSIHVGEALNEYLVQHTNRIHPEAQAALTLLCRDLLEGDHTNWTLQLTATQATLNPHT